MSKFLLNSSCNGSAPKKFAHCTLFDRDVLLLRMMRDRMRIRRIVAPASFGKTSLALGYASVVFGFERVCWVSATSPCFVRDLDGGSMGVELLDIVPQGLVVFEDVPALDAHRNSLLEDVCRTLTSAGVEVILTATPANNPLPTCDACDTFTARDLMYNESELSMARMSDPSLRIVEGSSCPADRIAGIAMRDDIARERFLSSIFCDESPVVAAVLFESLVLGRGSVDGLVVGGALRSCFDYVETHYPFVEVDSDGGEFQVRGFSIDVSIRAGLPYLKRMALAAGFEESSAFVVRLADELLAAGRYERVSRLMSSAVGVRTKTQWLRSHQDECAEALSLASVEELYESIASGSVLLSDALRAGSAMRRLFIGNTLRAFDMLARLSANPELPAPCRLKCSSLAFLHAEKVDRACRVLSHGDYRALSSKADAKAVAYLSFWLHVDDKDGGVQSVLLSSRKTLGEDEAHALALACAVHNARLQGSDVESIRLVCVWAARYVSGRAMCLSAFVLLRELVAYVDVEGVSPLVSPFCSMVERCQAQIASQQALYRRAHASEDVMRGRFVGLESGLTLMRSRPRTPLLRVKLFGGFQLGIDGVDINMDYFSRMKVRALLALLVIEADKDVPRDTVAERLWPDSSLSKARHNLNSTYSRLKKALTLPSGESPYVTRTQNVLRLRGALVESDTMNLNDVCHTMRFNRLDADGYNRLLGELRAVYSGELLPGDGCDYLVNYARNEFRHKTVDAVLCAARALQTQGENEMALLFARQAIEWDAYREDCYEMLMNLQARCGQRPATGETWSLYCRRMRELGMEPSLHMNKLYARIISSEGVA